jgi:adhesin HecA-like repeat protein
MFYFKYLLRGAILGFFWSIPSIALNSECYDQKFEDTCLNLGCWLHSSGRHVTRMLCSACELYELQKKECERRTADLEPVQKNPAEPVITDWNGVRLSQDAPKGQGPSLIRGQDEKPQIEVAEPVCGISINYFETFDLRGEALEILNPERAHTIVFMIGGEKQTVLSDVWGLSFEHADQISNATLVIQNPKGVQIENCTLSQISLHIPEGYEIRISGSGLRVPQELLLSGNRVFLDGPIFSSANISVKTLDPISCSLVQGHKAPITVGNTLVLEAPCLELSGNIISNHGKLQGDILKLSGSLLARTSLELGVQDLKNTGLIHSNSTLNIQIRRKLINKNQISAQHSLILNSAEELLNDQGNIYAGDSLKIQGNLLENRQGRIHAAGSAYLGIKSINTHRGVNLNWVADSGYSAKVHPGDFPALVYTKKQIDLTQALPLGITANGDVIVETERLLINASTLWSGGQLKFKEDTRPEIEIHSYILPTKRHLDAQDIQDRRNMCQIVAEDVPWYGQIFAWINPVILAWCAGDAIAKAGEPDYISLGFARLMQENHTALEYVYDGSLERVHCPIAGNDPSQFRIYCHDQHTVIPSTLIGERGVQAHAQSVQMHKIHEGDIIRDRPELVRKEPRKSEEVKPEEQVVSLSNQLRTLSQMLWLRYRSLPEAEPKVFFDPASEKSFFYLLQPKFWIPQKDEFSIASESFLQALEHRGSVVAFWAHPEPLKQAVQTVLHDRLGYFPEFSISDLVKNQAVGLQVGMRPGHPATIEQLKNLPPHTPILWGIWAGSVLEPVLYLDKVTLATARAASGNIIGGTQIDLRVASDAEIKGLIESMQGRLELRAKNIHLDGNLRSGEDLSVLSDKDFFAETLVGSKIKTSLEAKGRIGIHSGRDTKSIAVKYLAEGGVHIEADGHALILSLIQYEKIKNSWYDGVSNVQRTVDKKTHENNEFSTGGPLKIYSKKDGTIEGVNVDAKEVHIEAGTPENPANLHIRHVTDSVKVEEKRDYWGLFRNWNFFEESSSQEKSYDETVREVHIKSSEHTTIRAHGKLVREGTHIKASTFEIEGKQGNYDLPAYETHSCEKTNDESHFGFGGTAQIDELSIELGVGARNDQKEGVSITAKPGSTMAAKPSGGIELSDKEIIHEGTETKHTSLKAPKIVLTDAQNIYVNKSKFREFFAGVKAGVESAIPKIVERGIRLLDSAAETWEDGVNAGSNVLRLVTDSIAAVANPGIAGIWAAASVNAGGGEQQVTESVCAKMEFDGNSIEADDLYAKCVKAFGKSLRVRAKRLHGDAAKHFQNGSSWGINAQGNVPIPSVSVGAPSVGAGGHYEQSSALVHEYNVFTVEHLVLDIEEHADLKGFIVYAKDLEASFGSLLLESLVNTAQAGGIQGQLSLSQIQEIAKLGVSATLGGHLRDGKWVGAISQLVGTESAKIVVKGLLKLNGALIANAERDSEGKWTDKGKLQLSAQKLIRKDLENIDFALQIGGGFSTSNSRVVKQSYEAQFGLARHKQNVRSTIGQGDIRITENPEILASINRNLSQIVETNSFEIKPISIYIPILDTQGIKEVFSERFKQAQEIFKKPKLNPSQQANIAEQVSKDYKPLQEEVTSNENAKETLEEAEQFAKQAAFAHQESAKHQDIDSKLALTELEQASKRVEEKLVDRAKKLHKTKDQKTLLQKEIEDLLKFKHEKVNFENEIKQAQDFINQGKDREANRILNQVYKVSSFALGFIPVVGSAPDFYEAATGQEPFGPELSTTERVTAGIFGVVGLIPGAKWLGKSVWKWVGWGPKVDKAADAAKKIPTNAPGGIPGVEKPFRPPNSAHPPRQDIVDQMNSIKIYRDLDCSEIAERLLKMADGKGKIVKITPPKGKLLKLFEHGKLDDGFEYHQVFTDGRYIYDPRLSRTAIPKGDWEQMVNKLNPGALIK